MGIVVDDCHKKHFKSLDGSRGTQSLQFKDYTTIDLVCRGALMTFETEKLNLEDLENGKYPIFDIAIPGWNPKYHCDDPFAIDQLTQELQTNKMTAQDPVSKSVLTKDEEISIP